MTQIQTAENAVKQIARPRATPIPHYSEADHHPVLFYGGPFSNFVGGPFAIDFVPCWETRQHDDPARQIGFQTIEHFYQAMKAVDVGEYLRIAEEPNTWEAKKLGNRCKLRPDWEEVKYQIMIDGLRAKFAIPEFCDALQDTGYRYIAEDSPTDAQWGLWNKTTKTWTGRNLLGLALMQVRAEQRDEADEFRRQLAWLCPQIEDAAMISETMERERAATDA